MIISHNMTAMNSLRQLNIVNGNFMKSTEKLSSGYRINRAADDAAGLAISEKMRSQIRGLEQSVRNVEDGISYCQVADGALNEVHSILSRMYELSIQAANGTNTDNDRENLDSEVSQLNEELDRIFEDTEYNTMQVWGKQMTPVKTTVINTTQTETFPAVVFKTINTTSNKITNTNKTAVPQSSLKPSATDTGFTISWKGKNGTTYTTKEIPWDADLTGRHTVKLSDYMDYTLYPDAAGIDFNYIYEVNENSTIDDVKKAFNSSLSSVSTYTSEPVLTTVTNNSGITGVVSFSASINYDAQVAAGRDFSTKDTDFIVGTGITNPATAAVADNTPFACTFTMPGIGQVNAKATSAYYSGSYPSDKNDRTGEGIWWNEVTYPGGSYKSGKTYSISPNMDGIKESITNNNGHSLWYDNDKGGSISLTFSLTSANPYTKADGSTSTAIGNLYMTININKNKAATADDLIDYIRAAVAGVSDVDIYANGNTAEFRSYRLSDTDSSNKVSKSSEVTETKTEYKDTGHRLISIQAGANSGQTIDIEYDNLNTEILGLSDINISTQSGAMSALDKIKAASAIVSHERSAFGAYQNRMEHSVNNLQNGAENLQAAESQIRDSDMAEEMVLNSKFNILLQVGQNVVAHANHSKENVIQLLQ